MNDVLSQGSLSYVVCPSCRAQVPVIYRVTSASTKGFVSRLGFEDADATGHRIRVDHASPKFVRFAVDPKSCLFRGVSK